MNYCNLHKPKDWKGIPCNPMIGEKLPHKQNFNNVSKQNQTPAKC